MRNWTQSCLTKNSTPTKQFFYDSLNLNQDGVLTTGLKTAPTTIWWATCYITLAHWINPFFNGFSSEQVLLEDSCAHRDQTEEIYSWMQVFPLKNKWIFHAEHCNLQWMYQLRQSFSHHWSLVWEYLPDLDPDTEHARHPQNLKKKKNFNWRGFSILKGFISISRSFYNIR